MAKRGIYGAGAEAAHLIYHLEATPPGLIAGAFRKQETYE